MTDTDALRDDLIGTIQATRKTEREVFASLDPAVRDRPIRPGDWSPKDHQAHLSAWKRRQAERFEAARTGSELPPAIDEDETDAVNAELHATRADWAWDDVAREADEVSERLIAEIRRSDPQVILGNRRLLLGTLGNGVLHTLTHLRWLHEADVGVAADRVQAFADEAVRLTGADGLPAEARAVGRYDVACFHALAGNLDAARPLLRDAFALSPELLEGAMDDPDLEELRAELPALAGR